MCRGSTGRGERPCMLAKVFSVHGGKEELLKGFAEMIHPCLYLGWEEDHCSSCVDHDLA